VKPGVQRHRIAWPRAGTNSEFLSSASPAKKVNAPQTFAGGQRGCVSARKPLRDPQRVSVD